MLVSSILFFCNSMLYSQTKLASLFKDHMVLQQNSNAVVWGWDKPNTRINISAGWGGQYSTMSDDKGKWKFLIKTEKAGGPYELQIKGSETIIISDVLLGEVWLCSGQSNMEMPLKGFAGQPIIGSNDFVLDSKNHNIRLFNVNRSISSVPLETCEGSWNESTPNNVLNFSAVAYLYGKILQENLGVPIGIICSSVGGTRAEAWTDKETLTDKKFGFDIKMDTSTRVGDKNGPARLYNGMIHPLIPFTIKGAIWYQGEANIRTTDQYATLFPAMINSWREQWNIGDFPFYYVQIAPFKYGSDVNSAYLREVQLKSMETVPNSGMAVTLDIGDEFCIHPAEKFKVAKRLSYWALAKTYGYKGLQFSGPVYKSMEIENNKITLNFDYAPNGVINFNKPLNHFTIAGKDKVFYPAKAEITRGKLTVYSKLVPNPVAVRYCWDNYVEGTLYNLAGLPASSFRTDNWIFSK